MPYLVSRRSSTLLSARAAADGLPSSVISVPIPAITHIPCGSIKIWPSSQTLLPTGLDMAS